MNLKMTVVRFNLEKILKEQFCVYFIAFSKKHDTPVKIGYTANINSRLVSLQTACPYPLHVIDIIDCKDKEQAVKLEAFLHRYMQAFRMEGEWFYWEKAGKLLNKALTTFCNMKESEKLTITKHKRKTVKDFINIELKDENTRLRKELFNLKKEQQTETV